MVHFSKLLKNPFKIIHLLDRMGLSKVINDRTYLKIKYRACVGKNLDLNSPRTFTEKLQWLKLYNRKQEYTMMVDKYAVKEYVSDIIGGQYLIPTLGVWDSFDDIDFDSLPKQFVLKCTHDSGGLVICKDKNTLDLAKVKKKIEKSLKRDYYLEGREWPYKNVPRRIIAEQYMEDDSLSDLIDYKFYCFGGEPALCQVILNRSTCETIDYYDMKWQHQAIKGLAEPYKPFSDKKIDPPKCFGKMIKLAKILSKGIPFVRVDFYEIEGVVYFGELTFYPAAGFGKFSPDDWNRKLGDLIILPKKGDEN